MSLYNAAAAVVDKVRTKHAGIRAALYALPISHGLRPTVQALVQESLKHADALVAAATATGLLSARAPARATSLRATVAKARADARINVVEADFLTIDRAAGPWAEATLAICDPSCSGSGNVAVGESPPEHSAAELDAFAAHQIAIVEQAMALPKMQTVVYSTCSVHRTENEAVVAKLLKAHGADWTLVNVLPDWPERGVGGDDIQAKVARRCVRASHAQQTHGFFVSCFERRSVASSPVKRKETPAPTPKPAKKAKRAHKTSA
ncbi:NOP2/Sun domain family, member 5 [Achlya hypogyna]|uniref:NOP2/Sun domain family, member 5 n=1 Tax=Achlya hypogyna TaxID=1202772 RepID=A0A1V9YC51_ACHHY|nr:NOP2/Sun domain family, member 5 [Achlya hypogyna]